MAVNYQERYDQAAPSYTKVNDKKFADLAAGTTVLIPSPQDIEAILHELQPGEHVGVSELRARLADRHGADGACPVMTGMNLRVIAELTFDALDAGVPVSEVVPMWRAVDPCSTPAKKRPGGAARVRQLRQAEL